MLNDFSFAYCCLHVISQLSRCVSSLHLKRFDVILVVRPPIIDHLFNITRSHVNYHGVKFDFKIFFNQNMHKNPALFCVFYFLFILNKSFFKITNAKHQTNLRSILRSQLFIKNKHLNN